MNRETKDLLGVVALGAAAGLGYWYFMARPKMAQAAAAAKAPTALPAGGPAGGPAPSVPALPQVGIRNVTLTNALQGADLTTGLLRIFSPGEVVTVYGSPIAGVTSFTDTNNSPPHLYTTQSVVAGLFH
jgi:hypothetical protein